MEAADLAEVSRMGSSGHPYEAIGGRLVSVRESRRLSQVQFAKVLRISKSALGRYERGERAPDVDMLTSLHAELGVDPGWVLTGEGVAPAGVEGSADAVDPDSRVARQIAKKAGGEGEVRVPIYGARPAAGAGAALEDYVEDWLRFPADYARMIGVHGKKLGAVRVAGDSMMPTLIPGELILIDAGVTEVTHDGIYVLRIDDHLVVKRVQLVHGGALRIVSDNPRYPLQELTADDARQLAVVGRAIKRAWADV